MREITTHKVNGLNEVLKIEAEDEPGAGGANHRYSITPTVGNARGVLIEFQKGPIQSYPNGLSNEALLAVVLDRLEGFQTGPFACEENGVALAHVRDAMQVLHKRTQERTARGVEGTLKQ